MIVDTLGNARRYMALNKDFVTAFEFLLRPDLSTLPPGDYAIDGSRVYAMVAMEAGREKEDAHLEIHRKYIDIQVVLAGTDDMGWKPLSSCRQPIEDYDQESDIQFFADDPDVWVPVDRGSFVIFFPEDAHMPLIATGQLHKVVVKIAVD